MKSSKETDRRVALWREFDTWPHRKKQQRRKSLLFWTKVCSSFRSSKEWQAIRKQVLEKNPLCSLCKKEANTAHHISELDKEVISLNKTFLEASPLDNLQSLCGDCHYNLHDSLIELRKMILEDKKFFEAEKSKRSKK